MIDGYICSVHIQASKYTLVLSEQCATFKRTKASGSKSTVSDPKEATQINFNAQIKHKKSVKNIK